MSGRFERIRPDGWGCQVCFAVPGGNCLNLEDGWQDLRKVKNATEEAGFLLIVFPGAGRLPLQTCGIDGQHPCREVSCPVMVQHTRKNVDQEVSGQRGNANQGTTWEKPHLDFSQWL